MRLQRMLRCAMTPWLSEVLIGENEVCYRLMKGLAMVKKHH